MTDDEDTDDNGSDKKYSIDMSAGDVYLEVSGPNADRVEALFDAKLQDAIDTAEQTGSNQYEVAIGAGHSVVRAQAETSDEAEALLSRQWDKLLEDVDGLSDEEREQIGLARQ